MPSLAMYFADQVLVLVGPLEVLHQVDGRRTASSTHFVDAIFFSVVSG